MNKLITIHYQIGEEWGVFTIVGISNCNVAGRHGMIHIK